MKLQTHIPFQKQSDNLISYHSDVLLLGSCFAEHIGEKLHYHKLKSLCNPFGILFHPKAIETLIGSSVEGTKYSEEGVFFHQEQWHSFDAHSKLSSSSKEALLERLNVLREQTFKQIKKATHVIVTLGTAWVYRFLKSDSIVANCHKVPQQEFSKELLSVEEISESLSRIIGLITTTNPNCTIIFTVSPVRHLKDGFVENTRSKAHLISAIHKTLEIHTACFYFPSYELMMDELRDYRFYNEDMLHPNPVAVNYIWDKFQQVWFTDEARAFSKRIDAVQKSLEHKPFNPQSKSHQDFLRKLDLEKSDILAQFPHITF